MQAVDNTVISAVVKAALRDQVAALSKALLNAQKAAAAGNKERAGREAVAAAQAAQATGEKFLMLQVEVRVPLAICAGVCSLQ
jgi:alanyl-tRNA synthetase